MSKKKKWFSKVLSAGIAGLLLSVSGLALDLEATVKITDPPSDKVRVAGRLSDENDFRSPQNWAFARSSGDAEEDRGERISALELTDQKGNRINFRRLIPGEYLAEQTAVRFSYQIDLSPPPQFAALAHLSWRLGGEQGILMTGDLLPLFNTGNGRPVSARIKFELPPGWQIFTTEKSAGENEFEVADIAKGVFLVGKNWRAKDVPAEDFGLRLVLTGEWLFSDAEAAAMAAGIFAEYRKLFGGEVPGSKDAQIILVPVKNEKGRWEAETRGGTVVIVSGDMLFPKPSRQRLHEQLRHELLHLWIPNSLALDGNYDWFYEGFTVYQALRTGLQLNRISFDDFLATLAEAYHLAGFQNRKSSLTGALQGDRSGVYARGMLVAFMTDAAILQKSRGKRSVEDILRQIYQLYRLPNPRQDGNIAVLRVLRSQPELRPVIEKYIEGTENIDWTPYLEILGIAENRTGFAVQLRVKDKLNGRQKDLLDKLGYNNWRKISEVSK